MTSFGSNQMNDLELRLARVEQRAPTVELPSVQVTVDNSTATPVAVLTDPLDYNVGGWAAYSTLTPSVTAQGVPGGAWDDGDEGYLPPQAHRIGNVVFLNGVIRRVGPTLVASDQLDSVMFRLPVPWRPARTVVLRCPCATTTAPDVTTTVGNALIKVTPNLTQNAGLVTLVSANVGLTSGSGWISLVGSFPATYVGDAPA